MALAAHETIDQALQAYVRAEPSITAIIGARFYPAIVAQNPQTPYGRYQRISTPRVSSHDGPSCLAYPRFQLDWIGGQETQGFTGYGAAVELATLARKALQDFSGLMLTVHVGRIIFEDERDLIDGDLKLVGRSQDVTIWHTEDSRLWL